MSDVTITGGTGYATGSASVFLEFSAGEEATGPLTWGQRVMWGPMLWFGKEANQFNISRPLVLAEPAEQGQLLVALRDLIERHETLRSRYVEHAGEPRQHVLASGSYDVTVVDDQAEPERVIGDLAARLADPVFDHEAEWPLRVGWAVDREGRVTAIALVGSHLAFDGWAFTAFVELLLGMLADDDNRVSQRAGSACDIPQPLEQAAFQSSPAGQQLGQLSLRYWEQQLSAAPASMFDLPRARTGDYPIERHMLDSTAVTEAAVYLAARTRTSFSSVLLCLTALILTAYNGHDTSVLKLISGNRLDRRSREMIAINAQDAFLTFPVPDVDLLTAVRQIHRCAFDAYRRAQYDPFALDATIKEAGRRRGVVFDLSAYFNNGHRGSDWPAASADLEPARLRRLRRDSRYVPVDPLSKSDMKYYIAATNMGAGVCRLGAIVDTAYLPGPLGEMILRGIETLLCDAVTGEVQVSEIAARIGLTPVHRGPDWARTPVGWVRPDDVAQLVGEAAGGVETAVFVQERVLTAYVAGGPVQLEALHQRVLDTLPAGPGVAAPAEYVICDSAPRAGTGLDGWRDMTVVARWSGRRV